MAFATGHLDDPQNVGAGETIGVDNVILTATTFEDELKVGRFAKLDAGSIDNLDSSATPTIAGVVLRNVASAVEDGDTIDADIYTQINYLRDGIVTIDVVAADTPTKFGTVYAKNTADADSGKASTVNDATTVDAGAEFLHEVQTNVWAIRRFK